MWGQPICEHICCKNECWETFSLWFWISHCELMQGVNRFGPYLMDYGFSFTCSAQNLCFDVNWFYALLKFNGTSKPLLTSKPSLTIALKILKKHRKTIGTNGWALKKTFNGDFPMMSKPSKNHRSQWWHEKKHINHSIALKNWPSSWSNLAKRWGLYERTLLLQEHLTVLKELMQNQKKSIQKKSRISSLKMVWQNCPVSWKFWLPEVISLTMDYCSTQSQISHTMLHSKTILSSQTGASKLFCIGFSLFWSRCRNWGSSSVFFGAI